MENLPTSSLATLAQHATASHTESPAAHNLLPDGMTPSNSSRYRHRPGMEDTADSCEHEVLR